MQLSQAQKRRMEAMSMNMGTRIVCGYLASLLFLGISLYLAVTYHTSGDLQSFWCYLALAAICLTLDVLVTINLLLAQSMGVVKEGGKTHDPLCTRQSRKLCPEALNSAK